MPSEPGLFRFFISFIDFTHSCSVNIPSQLFLSFSLNLGNELSKKVNSRVYLFFFRIEFFIELFFL